jgi:hypothetical protein
LKLFDSDLSTGMRLEMCVELIVFLHGRFASSACADMRTKFLKVHAYPIEGEATSAMGTLNSRQSWA